MWLLHGTHVCRVLAFAYPDPQKARGSKKAKILHVYYIKLQSIFASWHNYSFCMDANQPLESRSIFDLAGHTGEPRLGHQKVLNSPD